MRAFWLALQFLTRLPAPRRLEFSAKERGRSVLFYPLVGLLIGALLVALQWLLAHADPGVQAVLLLLAWVLITGGLHLDGLADSADAWVGAHGDRARALEIMKDPRSGPAGVMAVVLLLIVKFAALSALSGETTWLALLIAPLLGRAAPIVLFLTTLYVRPQGIGAAHAAYLPRDAAIAVLIVVAAVVVAAAEWDGLWLLGVAAVSIYLLRRTMHARLGGATGDTLGASCEIVEAAALVTLALLWA